MAVVAMGSGDCIFLLYSWKKKWETFKKILIYNFKIISWKLIYTKHYQYFWYQQIYNIYVIDSEIQVARFLTVIALIILLTNDFKIKNREIINILLLIKSPFFKYIFYQLQFYW
jgi:hypothetical protein